MKNIIKQKAVYLALIFALGCVSCATTYFKGSDSSEIADNFYNVEFDGNRYNSLEQIVKFTYLKAAETALANGYNYFYILDTEGISKNLSETEPYIIKDGQISGINMSFIIGSDSPDSITYSMPASMAEAAEDDLDIKIILVNEKLDNAPYPLNAELITEDCASLVSEVRIEKTMRNGFISVTAGAAVGGGLFALLLYFAYGG